MASDKWQVTSDMNHGSHSTGHDPQQGPRLTALWERLRLPLLGAIALGLIGCIIAWVISPQQFYYSYLAAYMFCFSLLLGMLFFVMLHHVTDAGWSTIIRRPAEQCLAALPVLILLFVPILIAALFGGLFPWLDIDVADDPLLEWKRPYLNLPFFLVRAVIYFAIIALLVGIMRGRSLRQDESGDPQLSLSMRRWSGPGFILYALALTFAAFDWIMSLDFHWFSTIFGVYVFSGAAVSGLALLSLMAIGLGRGPLWGLVPSDHLHDLGKLVFGFAVFWAYIAFSQYFLIWYSNIPEETLWFIERWRGTDGDASWWIVSLLLPLGYFIIPFVALMSAIPKRSPAMLGAVSIVLLVVHYIDMYWMVMPVLHHHGPALGWIWVDASALLFTLGACVLIVLKALAVHPLYPVRDPRLPEALAGGPEQVDAEVGPHEQRGQAHG